MRLLLRSQIESLFPVAYLLHHEAAAVLSIIVGLDSVSRAAFVRRFSGPQLNRYRTAALRRQLAGMDRRITDRRIEGVNVGAPHRAFFATGGTFEFEGLAGFETDH